MQSCKLFGTSRLAGGFLFIQKRRGLLRAFSFLASACHSLGRNRRIIRGKFDSDTRSARIPCRFSRASAADEGVQHRPAFRDHFHKFPQELNGLARQVVLFLVVHRMRVQPGQAPGAAVAQPSLAGEDHKLGLPAELPAQRPPGPLVPDHDAPPRPARRLYSVSHGGKLPPVRKHEQGRSVPGHAPALGKPQRSPHDKRALIPVVPEHRGVCLHCPVVLILDSGIGLAGGS